MGFFDLNIPYPEPSSHASKSTIESNRTRLVVKAMELGYSGIAYNRTIKGVMSDHHRCSISSLALSSLLNVVPFLSSSAKLHRDLLGIPSSTPFRQYTRLTVCVENSAQGQALNSGNPILKTYDLIAVKPSNQTAFDLACERMEVDIISIDFSTKLPFRLKQPMVKAATQRGVCFEISYSGLIADVQMRRQLISSAKLLMDWTRGRDIIFSSAAPSVNELRGPCDVANLLSLLGLSKEQAKAAISKNCRALLTNSLRKKRFYKEAIRVEVLSSDKEAWHQELRKWDPISSGEGDILLDDMTKSDPASCKASNIAKAIDFVSVVNNLPSNGFQVQDFLPTNDTFPASANNKGSFLPDARKVNQSTPVHNNLTEHPNRPNSFHEPDKTSSFNVITEHHIVRCGNVLGKNILNGTAEAFNSEDIDTQKKGANLELKSSIYSDVPLDNMEKFFSASCNASSTANAVDFVSGVNSFPSNDFQIMDLSPEKHPCPVLPYNKVNLLPNTERFNQSKPVPNDSTEQPNRLDACPEQHESSSSDAISTHHIVSRDIFCEDKIHKGTAKVLNSKDEIDTPTNATKLELKNCIDSDVGHTVLEINTSTSEISFEDGQFDKREPDAIEPDEMPQQTPFDGMNIEDDSTVAIHLPPEVIMKEKKFSKVSTDSDQLASVQSASGRMRMKRRAPRGPLLFPLKRMLNLVPFKRKGKKVKRRNNL